MNDEKSCAIGLVVTGFDKGGLEQVVYNLYLGYRAKGWDAFILCEKMELVGYFAERLLDCRDLMVFNGDRETFLSFCYIHHITHLHYHYQTFFLNEARKYGIKTLYTIHNTYVWFNNDVFKYYGGILKRADGIVAVSTAVKKYFCLRGLVDPIDVDVITNGIDTSELNLTSLPGKYTKKGLGLTEDAVTLCIAASILPAKHQVGMVGVMEKVIKSNANVHLLILGNVGDEDYSKYLTNTLKKSAARNNIHVIPYFDHRYIGEFLRETVDIFMLPTLYEGCSNAVLEAAYCGKPMILTDVGNAQNMRGKSMVTIVPPAYDDILKITLDDITRISKIKKAQNCEDLVEAVLDNVEHLSEYTEKAREFTANKESLDTAHMVEQYCELITKL